MIGLAIRKQLLIPHEDPHLPGQPLIDSYGNGGFRFADMSHRGSILIVPSGVYAWPVSNMASLKADDLSRVLNESDDVEILLLGTGETLVPPTEAIRQIFRSRQIVIDPMSTGAAARTYNVLRAEERCVAAALIAVA